MMDANAPLGRPQKKKSKKREIVPLSVDPYPPTIVDRQRNQKVLQNVFYQYFSIYLGYIMAVGDSQNLIAPHTIIRETCPDHSEEQ